MLEPPLVLARILALPVDDLQQLVSIGYFRELRFRGMSLRLIASRLKKSLRTVATLSRMQAERGPLLGTSRRIGWRRRIVQSLADDGPETIDELAAELPEVGGGDLRAEVEELVAQGILARGEDGVLSVDTAHFSLVRDDLEHRLDSLRHFLAAVTHVVYRRFFSADRSAEAFARVMTFQVSRAELQAIREATYAALELAVHEADARAATDVDAVQASVAMCFAEMPTDPAWRPRRG